MSRIANGWSLVTQSWSVLRLDKELMLFPIFSGVAAIVVVASFVVPFFLVPGMPARVSQALQGDPNVELWQRVAVYAGLFGFYLVTNFVVVFFNAALVACAVIRFAGGDPTVGDGLRGAVRRLPQILAWSVVSATLGMVLQLIESRSKLVGRIVARVIGVVWATATYFVVPILAVERLGPIAALKRSVALLKASWGEGLVGNISLSGIGFLLTLPAVLLMGVGIVFCIMARVFWGAAVVGAVGLIYLIGLGIVLSTLRQVFLAGLYIYASEKRVPTGFAEGSLRGAFVPKT
jgi:hypothetical protein